jgi:hypothetical protein
MSGKDIPQSMRSCVLVDAGRFGSSSYSILQTASFSMVALQFAAARIPGDVLGWEDLLPFPLKLRIGVFNS